MVGKKGKKATEKADWTVEMVEFLIEERFDASKKSRKRFLSCKNNAQASVAWNLLGLALNEKFKTNLDVDSQIKPRVDRLKAEYRVCLEKFKKTV
jgi:hypothetical protein